MAGFRALVLRGGEVRTCGRGRRWGGFTYGVMGMLERSREPRVACGAPSLREVAARASALLFGFAVGVSKTRRRNCVLFMVGTGPGLVVSLGKFLLQRGH